MSAGISVDINKVNETHWNGLKQGKLFFQSCACGNRWLPPRQNCPACLGEGWQWETARGSAKVISWVVFHVAYHPNFQDKLPYNVAIVKLEEGPQMITNIIGDMTNLAVGDQVMFETDQSLEQPLALFKTMR